MANIFKKLSGADKIPDAPDLSHLALASEEIARLNQKLFDEQMDWVRQERLRNQDVLAEFLGTTRQAQQQLADEFARYQQTFRPLEEAAVREAQEYASPARMEREIGAAIADTGAAFEAQRQNALRRLESYGVDPSTTRSAALDASIRAAQAAAQAAAGMGARQRVEDTARQLRTQAIDIGRGAVEMGTQGATTAAELARPRLGGSLATSELNASLPQTAIPFQELALQGYGQSANMRLGQSAQAIAAGQARANAWGNFLDTALSFVPVPDRARRQADGQADGGMVRRRAIGYADGGLPARRIAVGGMYQDGGGAVVDPTGRSDGSGIDDRVNINVSEGEYIIPADVVRYKGIEFFDKLVEKYHVPADVQRSAAVG